MDEISVAVNGQVQATVNAELLGGLGDLFMKIMISDINSMSKKKFLVNCPVSSSRTYLCLWFLILTCRHYSKQA